MCFKKKKREKKLSVTIYNVFFPAALTAFQASWLCREGADALKSSNCSLLFGSS